MKKIISVLIPTYNQIDTFNKILSIYSNHPKVKIIVSDDSTELNIQKKIKKLCEEKEILYFRGPQTNAIKNWNFLLEKIDTPFFVLNHHDDCPNNLNFLDHLDKDITGILLLPCTSYISNKMHVRLSSRHQRINIKFLKIFPNVLINFSPNYIVNRKLGFNKFRELYVDDW